jgi:hypothetical protein
LLIISFTAVPWFSGLPGRGTFLAVHDLLRWSDGASAALSTAYFGWLGWLLSAVAVTTAVAANLAGPLRGAFCIIGALTGLAGAIVTLRAIEYASGAGYRVYIEHARAGFYLALVGFLFTASGSLVAAGRNPR